MVLLVQCMQDWSTVCTIVNTLGIRNTLWCYARLLTTSALEHAAYLIRAASKQSPGGGWRERPLLWAVFAVRISERVGTFSFGILLTASSPSVSPCCSWRRPRSRTVPTASSWGRVSLLCLWRPSWHPAYSGGRRRRDRTGWPRSWVSEAGTAMPTAAEATGVR